MNVEVKLYREADMMGDSYGGKVHIPGLISKDIESTAKQAQQVKALQANFKTDNVPPLAQMDIASNLRLVNTNNNIWEWEAPIKDSSYWDYYSKQPGIAPMNPYIEDKGKYYPWDQGQKNSGPFGPPSTPMKPYHDAFDTDAIAKQLAELQRPKKSAFEELIDQLFTLPEKEQVLIDMGYRLEKADVPGVEYKITRVLADGTVKTITNSIHDLFLKEITVKFKNLLMAKASLKLKI